MNSVITLTIAWNELHRSSQMFTEQSLLYSQQQLLQQRATQHVTR
jgi:hypothetical protein